MSVYQHQSKCPDCKRGCNFILAGGPCAICRRCCDCCSCNTLEFSHMHEEVRDLYDCDLVDLFAGDDPFSMALKIEPLPAPDMYLFDKNMVRIAIWPYNME